MKKAISPFYKSTVIAICLSLMIRSIALAASGDLDTTFSGDGKINQDFGASFQEGYDIATQSDGKVVVVGIKYERFNNASIVVARYNLDGSLDKTFSGDGRRVVPIKNTYNDEASAVAIQADGKIVIGGTASRADAFLVRLNPNGSLDKSFDHDGIVKTNIVPGLYNTITDIALQGNKIVAVGTADDTVSDADGVIYRYNANGSLDATFSGDGILIVDNGTSNSEFLNAVKIYGGKIYTAGEISTPEAGIYDFFVARINANGTLDTSFSGDGMVVTDFGTSINHQNDMARDLVVYDGKVIVVGGYAHLTIAQYTASGSLDPTFNGNGKLKDNFGFTVPGLESVLIRDGKIIVVGRTNISNPGEALIARFDLAGNLDATFGGDGIVTTAWGANAVYNAVVNKSGRIYVVGESDGDFIVAAYRP
jgi:uncharacterized delta-60 repeat protein